MIDCRVWSGASGGRKPKRPPGRVAQEVEASAHMGGARLLEKKEFPDSSLHGHTLQSMACGADEVKNPLPGPADGKEAWRRWALAVRRAAAAEAVGRGRVVEAVRAGVARWLAERPPTTVLLYRAMGDELSLDPLVAAGGPHRWATTRTPPKGPLTLHPWNAPLEQHRFGFLQPRADAPVVAAADVGVVLVPGLVFDRSGYRVGYGKGYYDRLLASLPAAVPVGITEMALVVDRLPSAGYDVPMRLLATEAGVARLRETGL